MTFFAHIASIRNSRARQINGSHRISVITPASAHDRLCSFPPPCSLPTTSTPKRAQRPNVQIRHLTFSPGTTILQNPFSRYLFQHWHRATTRTTWWTSQLTSLTWIYYLNRNRYSRSKHKLSLFLREDLNLITTVCQFSFLPLTILITANLKTSCQQTETLRLSSSICLTRLPRLSPFHCVSPVTPQNFSTGRVTGIWLHPLGTVWSTEFPHRFT